MFGRKEGRQALGRVVCSKPSFGGKQAIASTIGSPVINQWGGTRISREETSDCTVQRVCSTDT